MAARGIECLNHPKTRGDSRPRLSGRPRGDCQFSGKRMSETKKFAEQIIRTLRDAGHPAYLVGGCVRDLLLGIEPTDYDVTTDATPDEVMRIFPETYAVGAQFGVVLVPIGEAGGNTVEVATFRSDIGYSDGRHPDQVRFSKSAREDVERRDFTINGLLLDPVKNEVLDFVGGRKDLEAGIIRTIGRSRATLLRRQAAHAARGALCRPLRLQPSSPQRLLPSKSWRRAIHQVSRERVRDELTKMLTEGHARQAFLLLDQTGLLQRSPAGNFRDEGRAATAGVSS